MNHKDYQTYNKKPQMTAICAHFAAKYLEPRQKFDLLINVALASLIGLALLEMLIRY